MRKALVAVMLASSMLFCTVSPFAHHPKNVFDANRSGNSSDEMDDFWNFTSFGNKTYPNGITSQELYNYDDVAILINNNSDASRTIGWAFATARNISADRVLIFENESAPTKETINREQFDDFFATPLFEMLQERNLTRDINYLVTTKGIPLRVNGGNDKASFDQEIALVGGIFDNLRGDDFWFDHNYGPLSGNELEAFSRDEYGFYLVTRLTGYDVDTALKLIEMANNSLSERGDFVLDLATNRNQSGYKFWNDDLYIANTSLHEMNLSVVFDETSHFLTNISNVLGYASWGSNDGSWGENQLPNSGFDTSSNEWSSGSKFWNIVSPILQQDESFDWSRQTQIKRNGNAAIEGRFSPGSCGINASNTISGLYGEYFDNDGISYNSSLMPDLTNRTPDVWRLETEINYPATQNAWEGLDSRFEEYWSAKFTGYITIPESGNWTFFLRSDDGTTLYLDEILIAEHQGTHGMSEQSNTSWIDAGEYAFRSEFFEHGGYAGYELSWQGPNQSKEIIPESAFRLSNGSQIGIENLIHHWEFNQTQGSLIPDSIGSVNLTISGNNGINGWEDCLLGNCFVFDGLDDIAEVDIPDMVSDFSLSIWVNTSNITQNQHASIFTIGTTAGDNESFQLETSGGNNPVWQLYHDQTYPIGPIIHSAWTHLGVTFSNQNLSLYLNGQLTSNITVGVGEINNFEIFKLGANRAGNTFFEGKVDEVKLWNRSLSSHEMDLVFQQIAFECPTYGGAPVGIAEIEQVVDIEQEFLSHPWIVSGYVKQEGWINAGAKIVIGSLNQQNQTLSENETQITTLTTSWNGLNARFRPHENATKLSIKIIFLLDDSSRNGSVYADTMNLKVIRPHMRWVNGSIGDTAVSTGGRSFTWDTTYGQSLVADLLEDGISSVKGYVYEPYLTTVSYPSVLFSTYAQGFNMAEAYLAANKASGWMGVVVGDPKMAPFADRLHDIEIVNAYPSSNFSVSESGQLEVAIQNLGLSQADGMLVVRDIIGGNELLRMNISIPGGESEGSRTILNLDITSMRAGWNDVTVFYEHHNQSGPERVKDNNVIRIQFWVNSPPVIEDLYCNGDTFSRGDSFSCTVMVDDDDRVNTVTVGWSITDEQGNTTTYTYANAGSSDGINWWTIISLPADIPLGFLNIHAIANDLSNQTGFLEKTSIANVTNAEASWYGVHLEGVDNNNWNGESVLPPSPLIGYVRGTSINMTACVLDPDHNFESEIPRFVVSKGNLSELRSQNSENPFVHCYVAEYELPVKDEIDPFLIPFTVELYDHMNNKMITRTIQLQDLTPEVNLRIVNENNSEIESINSGNHELLEISIFDLDDPYSNFDVSLEIKWPGGATQFFEYKLDSPQSVLYHPLIGPDRSINNGDIEISVTVYGLHESMIQQLVEIPLLLQNPKINYISTCNLDGEIIDEITLGIPFLVGIESQYVRPIIFTAVSLGQDDSFVYGVPYNADGISACGEVSITDDFELYRLVSDATITKGNASVRVIIRDIDGLSHTQRFDTNLNYSAPIIDFIAPDNVSISENLKINAAVSDSDGVTGTMCGLEVYSDNISLWNNSQNVVVSEKIGYIGWTWPLPNDIISPVSVTIVCTDVTNTSSFVEFQVPVDFNNTCEICDNETTNTTIDDSILSSNTNTPIYVGIAIIGILFILITLFTRKSNNEEEIIDTWDSNLIEENILWNSRNEANDPQLENNDLLDDLSDDSVIPKGWTTQQFIWWLDGPLPEGWTEEQWNKFREENEYLRSKLTDKVNS